MSDKMVFTCELTPSADGLRTRAVASTAGSMTVGGVLVAAETAVRMAERNVVEKGCSCRGCRRTLRYCRHIIGQLGDLVPGDGNLQHLGARH